MYYAQINPDNKLVIGIHDMSQYDDPNYIQVDSFDASLLGKVYDEENKTFIENPNQPQEVESEEAPAQTESDTTLTMMETIASNYEEIQSLKAEIETLKGGKS